MVKEQKNQGQQETLALFPLSTLLFPSCSLLLKIFEQRYLSLLTQTMRDNSGFGLVLLEEGREVAESYFDTPKIFSVGSYVEVTDWDQLPNGLLGVTVTARRRFRILDYELDQTKLMHGNIEWLEDEPDHAIEDNFDGLLSLLDSLQEHPEIEAFALPPVNDSLSLLTWQLAQLLPLSDEDKLALLMMSDPVLRARRLAQWLDVTSLE